MGLRCLIGHDYGRARTDEERDDHGDEVVVTVQEYRECSRCGHRKVISENTEVTAKPGGDGEADDATDADRSGGGSAPSTYDDVTAEEDDGVILEDESGEAGRGHGEWPAVEEEDAPGEDESPRDWPEVDADADEGVPAEDPEAWPEAEGEDEGFDAEPDDGRRAEDVSFGGGLTPEPAEPPGVDEEAAGDADDVVEAPGDDDAAPATSTGAPTDAVDDDGFTAAAASTAGEQRLAAAETEVVCPECGHTAPGQATSLRPGDICPECRRGYLTERATE